MHFLEAMLELLDLVVVAVEEGNQGVLKLVQNGMGTDGMVQFGILLVRADLKLAVDQLQFLPKSVCCVTIQLQIMRRCMFSFRRSLFRLSNCWYVSLCSMS